jgi:lipopolysaccharide/colanic/teichoic acid biosynthesis glycosyltransferase
MRHGETNLTIIPRTAEDRRGTRSHALAKRLLDVVVSSLLLVLLLPLLLLVAAAVKLTSRGPLFFRSARVGLHGDELRMLKFRKMRDSAAGPALTAKDDARFTRVGRLLALSKLDEMPQLWNVVKGEMSLVGPRPEDPGFVAARADEYARILTVKPGITGLCQLAFVKESELLDSEGTVDVYVRRLLPKKIELDLLYVERRSISLDLLILAWTAAAVFLRRDVAVHRETARLSRRRRPKTDAVPVTTEASS